MKISTLFFRVSWLAGYILLTCILCIVVIEVLAKVPVNDTRLLIQQFPHHQLDSVFVEKFYFYMYMLNKVWLLWFVPLLALLMGMLAFLNWPTIKKSNQYQARIYNLEIQNSNLIDSERKLVELSYNFNTNIFKLAEMAHIALLEIGLDGRIVRATSPSENLFALWNPDKFELESNTLANLIPGLQSSKLQGAVNYVLSHGNVVFEEIDILNKRFFLTLAMLPSEKGVYVAVMNTTAQHRTDAFFQTTENLLRQLVQFSPSAIAVVDREWRFIHASKGWLDLFNVQTVEGKYLHSFNNALPHDWHKLREHLQNGETLGRDEENFKLTSGDKVLAWQLRPWLTTTNDIAGYLYFINDVTHIKQASRLLQSKENEENKLAYTDVLTGIANRTLFLDRLNASIAQAYRQLNKVAVLFLDLDGFKAINDNLGHEAGDMLLKKVATRLKESVRTADTVARLGGDEFTVILNLNEANDAQIVAEKIIESIAQPYDLGDTEGHVTVSIGIAIYPDQAENSATLIKNADAAMYAAKQAGKNQFRLYAQDMGS